MATCTLTGLVDDAACFQCLSALRKKAALIYLNVLELAALGGTDYDTADFPSELVDDSNALFRIEGEQEFWDSPMLNARVAIAKSNAVEAGATVPDDVSDWEPKLTLILNSPNPDILLLWMECQLGVHATK